MAQDIDIKEVRDAHCHLSVKITDESVRRLIVRLNGDQFSQFPQEFFHLMSTNHIDIDAIDLIVTGLDRPLVSPYFGIHPWYSHLFTELPACGDDEKLKYDHYNQILSPPPSPELLNVLPVPFSLEDHLQKIEKLCQKHNGSVGEIGLDKLFRIPTNGFYGNQDLQHDVGLSNSKVKIDHQSAVFRKQLELAKRSNKQVSVHCVKAHGPLYDIISKCEPPHVILHSFTGSADQAKMWVKKYEKLLSFSFSNYINGDREDHLQQILEVVPSDQLLVESDMGIDECIGDEYAAHLIGISAKIRELKAWENHQLYDTIQSNQNKFKSLE